MGVVERRAGLGAGPVERKEDSELVTALVRTGPLPGTTLRVGCGCFARGTGVEDLASMGDEWSSAGTPGTGPGGVWRGRAATFATAAGVDGLRLAVAVVVGMEF